MRILKWSLLILLILILIPIGGFASLIGGLWSYDFKLEKDSALIGLIKERTGYDVVITEPVRIKLSNEFTLLGENIIVRTKYNNSGQNLAEIGFLDLYGDVDFGVLWGERPDIVKLDAQRIVLNLERDAQGEFVLPKLAHILQQDAPSDILISSAFASQQLSLDDMPVEDLKITDMQIHVTEPDQDPLSVTIATMEVNKPLGNADGFLQVQGDYNYNPFSVDVDITRYGAVSGTVQFVGTDVTLSGQILGEIEIDSVINISNTLPLSRLLAQPLPEGPFNITAKTHVKNGLIKIALERLQSKRTLLSGVINLSPKGRALTADLQGREMNIADFIPVTKDAEETSNTAQASSAADDGRVIPDIALPEALMRKHLLPEYADIQVDIQLGSFHAGKVLLQDVRAKLILDDRGAEIDIDEASLGLGGKLAGQLGFKVGKQPKVISDLRLHTTPISTFQPFIPVVSRLDGVVNFELKGVASGTSLRALAENYSGDVKFSLYDGYIHLPEQASKLLATVAPAILDEGLLIVKCADFQSTLQDGVDPNFNGVLLSRAMLAFGGGSINLGQEQMNLLYQNELSVLGATMGMPLGVQGSFATPKFKPDLKSFLAGKMPSHVAMPKRANSVCHSEVAANIQGEYSAGPAMLKLDGLGNLQNLTAVKEKIQDTVQDGVSGLKEKAAQKLIEKSLGGDKASAAQKLIEKNLDADKVDKIEEVGKNLLGKLKF